MTCFLEKWTDGLTEQRFMTNFLNGGSNKNHGKLTTSSMLYWTTIHIHRWHQAKASTSHTITLKLLRTPSRVFQVYVCDCLSMWVCVCLKGWVVYGCDQTLKLRCFIIYWDTCLLPPSRHTELNRQKSLTQNRQDVSMHLFQNIDLECFGKGASNTAKKKHQDYPRRVTRTTWAPWEDISHQLKAYFTHVKILSSFKPGRETYWTRRVILQDV